MPVGTSPESFSRGFSPQALEPLYELNGLFLRLLIDTARVPSRQDELPLVYALRASLIELTPASRQRIARCAVCLVDAGFAEEDRWAAVARGVALPFSASADWLSPEQAVQLAQMTLTLAWTIARATPETARIIFGMTRPVVPIVASLGIERIQHLVQLHGNWLRPAWENRPAIWRHLLSPADPPPASRLPPIHVRAMQRQLARLQHATSVSRATQPSHR